MVGRALRIGCALHDRVHVHRRDPVGRAARALRQRGLGHRRPVVAHARAALPRWRRLAGTPLDGVAFNPSGWKVDSIAAGVVDFVDSVREGRPPTVSGDDGLHGVYVAERAYASAAEPAASSSRSAREVPPMSGRLLYVTDVSPYAASPAGTRPCAAHGGRARRARDSRRSRGRTRASRRARFVHAPSVAACAPGTVKDATVLALFTIGETPWSERRRAHRDAPPLGRARLFGLHAAADSARAGMSSASCSAPASTGIPGRNASPSRSSTRNIRRRATCPPAGSSPMSCTCSATCGGCARAARGARRRPRHGAQGARRPSIGFPLAWCFEEGEGRVFYTALGHFPGV